MVTHFHSERWSRRCSCLYSIMDYNSKRALNFPGKDLKSSFGETKILENLNFLSQNPQQS